MTVWVVLAAGILVVALALAVVAYCLADCFTRTKRRRVQGTPADQGLRYDEVQFRAAGYDILRGWFLESPGARATVVIIHDEAGTRADPDVGLLQIEHRY